MAGGHAHFFLCASGGGIFTKMMERDGLRRRFGLKGTSGLIGILSELNPEERVEEDGAISDQGVEIGDAKRGFSAQVRFAE